MHIQDIKQSEIPGEYHDSDMDSGSSNDEISHVRSSLPSSSPSSAQFASGKGISTPTSSANWLNSTAGYIDKLSPAEIATIHMHRNRSPVQDELQPQENRGIAKNEFAMSREASTSLFWKSTTKQLTSWVDLALQLTWALISPVLKYAVPCLIALLLFWNAVQSVKTHMIQQFCANGPGQLSFLLPHIGLDDFCAHWLPTDPVDPLSHDDLTGIHTILDWALASKDLTAARQAMINASREAGRILAETDAFDDRMPEGTQMHTRALVYSAAERASQDYVERLYSNHTNFIDAVAFDAKLLNNNLISTLNYYGPTSFWLSSYWYRVPGLSRFTPLGCMEHDFASFAEDHSREVQKLKKQAEDLILSLKETDQARRQLSNWVRNNWDSWKAKCAVEKSTGYIWGFRGTRLVEPAWKPDHCHWWDPEELRQILQEDIGESLGVALAYAQTALDGYKNLKDQYDLIHSSLQRPSPTIWWTTTLESYKDKFNHIHKRLAIATDLLEDALWGDRRPS